MAGSATTAAAPTIRCRWSRPTRRSATSTCRRWMKPLRPRRTCRSTLRPRRRAPSTSAPSPVTMPGRRSPPTRSISSNERAAQHPLVAAAALCGGGVPGGAAPVVRPHCLADGRRGLLLDVGPAPELVLFRPPATRRLAAVAGCRDLRMEQFLRPAPDLDQLCGFARYHLAVVETPRAGRPHRVVLA